MVPTDRTRTLCDLPPRPDADYVLYWMTAARRPHYNSALEHAVGWAQRLQKPLVILEALRAGYRWASARHHRFVLDGMATQQAALGGLSARGFTYLPYVEPAPDAGRGLLSALCARAAVVVGDDAPAFFLPKMLAAGAAAARAVGARFEAIDSNGLLPMRAAPHAFKRAFDLRNFLKKTLWPHLATDRFPKRDPLQGVTLPALSADAAARLSQIEARWPMAHDALSPAQRLEQSVRGLDQSVGPVPNLLGGWQPAEQRLAWFIAEALPRYADDRNHPDAEASSGLSPYLHFGHLSPHAILAAVAESEGGWQPAWAEDAIAAARRAESKGATDAQGHEGGGGAGWWGMSPTAGGFMDELVTWRELGINACAFDPTYDRYDGLPAWARQTLSDHASDPRPRLYSLDQLAAAQTDDPLWNAAQRQLSRAGVIHNYLRMLWGKRVLSWTPSPEAAFEALVELNNRYALDGRDPNSYSGIRWVFGQYDRAWGPERPIYGKVRYMTSDSARQKLRLKQYLARWRA